MKPEIKDFLLSIFNNVWLWAVFLIVTLIIYSLSERKCDAIPKLFDIRGIISDYRKVFKRRKDFIYLLVSAIIGLIPMILDKSDSIQNVSSKNYSHKRKLDFIEDTVQTGMFDILISIIDLILIFLSIGTTSENTNSLSFSFLVYSIYWLFYLFSFNILIIMHKLYVVYFK